MDEEFEALTSVDGIDTEHIVKQINGEQPPATPPETPPATPPATPPETPPSTPPATPPAEQDKNIDQIEQQRSALLNEMFGERFKTVDDVKKANIPSILDEVTTLRESNKTLQERLDKKPKTQFVNDKLALFNEFVRETGIDNQVVFNRINNDKLAEMDPMQALVTKYMIDHPEQVGNEALIKRHFEKKFGIRQLTEVEMEDQSLVDEQELNKFSLQSEGELARKHLLEVKGKIKLPEPQPEEEPKPQGWTPEQKAANEKGWSTVGQKLSEGLAKLAIPMKDSKEAFLSYELSEDDQKELTADILDYAIKNQVELNESNVKLLANVFRNQIVIAKLPEIVHSVFEKTRNMTDEEVRARYEHPSAGQFNQDTPPAPAGNLSPQEEASKQAIDLELN